MAAERQIEDWLKYIQTLHSRTIEMGLDRVESVWQAFEHTIPCPVITVAGTNGKGSSVAMLESVYRHAGYKTGTFTSPHLVDYNERICIEGQPIDDASLLAGFEMVEAKRGETPLTYFEFGTVLALYCLVKAQVDILILEVGLGGRLDSTNIVRNDVALITSISVDHASWLGNTREVIATEKAGIIKANGLAVCSDINRPITIDQVAQAKSATLLAVSRDFNYTSGKHGQFDWSMNGDSTPEIIFTNLKTNLVGQHQNQNASGVIAVVQLLQDKLPVVEASIRLGLSSVAILGRQQWVAGAPNLLLDVSHNQDSIEQLVHTIKQRSFESARVLAVFGALEDKDISAAVQQLIPVVHQWHLCSIAGERGQTAKQLHDSLVTDLELSAEAPMLDASLNSSPIEAYQWALSNAKSEDTVLIFGSFHVVGDIIAHLR